MLRVYSNYVKPSEAHKKIALAIVTVAFLAAAIISDSIVVATVPLVLITMYYAYQTGETVKEMKMARMAMYMPILDIEGYWGDKSLQIHVSNIGSGSVYGLTVFPRIAGGRGPEFYYKRVKPEETENKMVNVIGKVISPEKFMVDAKIVYSDVLGEEHVEVRKIPISRFKEATEKKG